MFAKQEKRNASTKNRLRTTLTFKFLSFCFKLDSLIIVAGSAQTRNKERYTGVARPCYCARLMQIQIRLR